MTRRLSLLSGLLRSSANWKQYPFDHLAWYLRRHSCRGGDEAFLLEGMRRPYFIHPYNRTWKNERCVELALALEFITDCPDEELLEIGNVISHYIDRRHTVLDKWERCLYRPVTNADIVGFDSGRTFLRILSISTFEHIGWDDVPRDPERVIAAIANVRGLLKSGGQALITVPAGHHPLLPKVLQKEAAEGTRLCALHRVSADNRWEECTLTEALACSYDRPYRNGNGLVCMFLEAA